MDEKWFVFRLAPHSQNDRYRAPANHNEVVECKKEGGGKVMVWVSIADGHCIPVVVAMVQRMAMCISTRY